MIGSAFQGKMTTEKTQFVGRLETVKAWNDLCRVGTCETVVKGVTTVFTAESLLNSHCHLSEAQQLKLYQVVSSYFDNFMNKKYLPLLGEYY